jgi:hypothetical protein
MTAAAPVVQPFSGEENDSGSSRPSRGNVECRIVAVGESEKSLKRNNRTTALSESNERAVKARIAQASSRLWFRELLDTRTYRGGLQFAMVSFAD